MKTFLADNWIALTALAISVLSFFKSNISDFLNYKKNKKSNNSAKIKVSFKNKKLIISNVGKSDARNIEVFIDEKEIQKAKQFASWVKNKNFSLLTPGNSIEINALVCYTDPKSYNVKVKWEDNFSKQNEIEDIINV